jgi:NAD(P)-dependent dehydrogenase (short-subunit alcohol dehydrogenase family)
MGGIGTAICQRLAKEGMTVVAGCGPSRDFGQWLSEQAALGYKFHASVGNVSDWTSCEAAFKTVVAEHGPVDILVNNAATNPVFGPIHDTTLDAFDKIMQVNLKAPFQLMRLCLPYLQASTNASVINISSVGGLSPEAGLGIYSVSKAALISMTKAFAKEWGGMNIRVNAICPGLIKTKFSEALWTNEAILHHMMKALPIKRMGTPEEIAAAALYLAAPAAGYTTGAVLTADGGFTI